MTNLSRRKLLRGQVRCGHLLVRPPWALAETDSRECRNCHEFLSADYDRQEPRSSERHEQAEEEGLTCIDRHKGIAHSLPADYDPEKDVPGQSIY